MDLHPNHLAYVGPYDLLGNNYADADWFRHVMKHGSYVSDVFKGFRGVPHCVIAIRRDDADGHWILRATIDSHRLDELVRSGCNGNQWAFLVSAEGLYQTTPPEGALLDRSDLERVLPHRGVEGERIRVRDRDLLQVTTWVNDGRWLLVVRRDMQAIRAPARRALALGALVTAAAALLLVLTTMAATRHLTRRIDEANAKREELARELLRSAKLACVGELATGLAHEINNPLAVISLERTNLDDCLHDLSLPPETQEPLDESLARIRRQVDRCAGITARMLSFGRRAEPNPRPTDLAKPVREVVRMMQKQARTRNIVFQVRLDDLLPAVVLDPTELEQVLVNLINNAMQAMPHGGAIDVEAERDGDMVRLRVRDRGEGIAPADMDRIFEPFFTTKPVGEGTGLGLSVCYGIVRSWGGEIGVESQINVGTMVTLVLPIAPSQDIEREATR